MGALRYYFATQDDLLLFATEEMARRVQERVTAIVRTTSPGIDRAEAILHQLLPLDANRTVEVRVWAAFMTKARISADLDRVRNWSWIGERFTIRLAVADAVGRGWPASVEAPVEPELERHVERLQAIVDGLSIQGVTVPEHVTTHDQRRVLRCALESIAEAVGTPPAG